MAVRIFEHRGNFYKADGELVDSDFGPEMKVVFYNDNPGSEKEIVGCVVEPASIGMIIGWFKEGLEDPEEEEEDDEE